MNFLVFPVGGYLMRRRFQSATDVVAALSPRTGVSVVQAAPPARNAGYICACTAPEVVYVQVASSTGLRRRVAVSIMIVAAAVPDPHSPPLCWQFAQFQNAEGGLQRLAGNCPIAGWQRALSFVAALALPASMEMFRSAASFMRAYWQARMP